MVFGGYNIIFGLFRLKSGLVLQRKNYVSITKQIFGLKEFLTLYTRGNISLAIKTEN
jgi:hypothetical protein